MSTFSTIGALRSAPPPRAALDSLLKEAGAALHEPRRTPLDKRGTAPSGVRRDYYSVGRYYWPPEAGRPGAPWIHRDGEVSPEALAEGDFPAWCRMGQVVETLALAWVYTGEERYATRAMEWIDGWLVSEETALTPHFRHAAVAPGRNDGGGIGLIEAVEPLSWCLNGAALLRASPFWSAEMEAGLKVWLGAFLRWITTHPNALPALRHPNNIGTWTETLVALIALYLEEWTVASERYRSILPARVAAHLEEDGSQPGELKRTLSFHYSCYQLEAFLRWAELAARAGESLDALPAETVRSLRNGLLFLARNQPWPYPNLGPVNLSKLGELMTAYLTIRDGSDAELSGALEKLAEDAGERWHLMGNGFYLLPPLAAPQMP